MEVTEKIVFPAATPTFLFGGETLKVGTPAACVTVTTTGLNPATITVILAERGAMVVFSEYVAVKVPEPVPEGVTVHHAALLEAVHATCVATEKAVLPPIAATF